MAGYDPQARRPRPTPPSVSPVDGMLDKLGEEIIEDDEPSVPSEAPVIDLPLDGLTDDATLEIDGERLLPFETPPVEMTDESADLLHRFGVLAAVAALVLVLVAFRRRRRDA
ncbi:MAG: hypothetical protein QF844_10610 [Acidimicrobiales bacterium]|jgi:MYXO-CTERM domain-containing protein|nr:hypothetical protein [Acidimicrobiales bacterium]